MTSTTHTSGPTARSSLLGALTLTVALCSCTGSGGELSDAATPDTGGGPPPDAPPPTRDAMPPSTPDATAPSTSPSDAGIDAGDEDPGPDAAIVEDAGSGPSDGSTWDASDSAPDACATNDAGCTSSPPPSSRDPMGTLRGVIFGTDTDGPLDGVAVRVGSVSATTDADGAFVLPNVPANQRVVLKYERAGYAPGLSVVEVFDGGSRYYELVMVPVGEETTFDAETGGALETADGASASFAAGSLVTDDGTEVTGDVTARITPIDVRDPTELMAFPGDFVGDLQDGSRGLLETISPMTITVTQNDRELDLRDDQPVELTFPANGFNYSSITLWSLNESTGRWEEEGVARLMEDEHGRRVYRAQASHLSSWNCDRVYAGWTPPLEDPPPDRACVRACIKGAPDVSVINYQDAPDPTAHFRVRGVDWAGSAGVPERIPGEPGCQARDVKPNGTIEAWGDNDYGESEHVVTTVPSTGATAQINPTKCTDLGTLVLDPVILAECRRPVGEYPAFCMEEDPVTGEPIQACVDLLTDPMHCGSCDNDCSMTSGGNRDCIGGTCTCPGALEACPGGGQAARRNGVCIDTLNDRNNCGGCGNACATGDTCIDGECEPIVCAAGLTLCGNDCVNTSENDRHCGSCSTPCTGSVDGVGVLTCEGGQCVCANGETKCTDPYGSVTCTDTQTDRDNCGTCGTTCPTGQECANGSCQDIVCTSPTPDLCGNTCVDLQTDVNNCGACGDRCWGGGDFGDPAAVTCTSGACTCEGDLTDCDPADPLHTTCFDLQNDDFNCGSCGNECVTGRTCSAGVCTMLNCPSGEALCGDNCANLDTDLDHCGMCGRQCPVSDGDIECSTGSCVCASGSTACIAAGGEGVVLACREDTTTCGNVPVATCGDMEGDWNIDACGSQFLVSMTQVGCTFSTDHGDFLGWFSGTNSVTLRDRFGSTVCTATLNGDTLTGTCDGGSCALSGSRPACSSGEAVCNTTCVDTSTSSNHCGFCENDCGSGVCNAGTCEPAS